MISLVSASEVSGPVAMIVIAVRRDFRHLLAHDLDIRMRLDPLGDELRELVPVNRQRRPRRNARRRRRLHHD